MVEILWKESFLIHMELKCFWAKTVTLRKSNCNQICLRIYKNVLDADSYKTISEFNWILVLYIYRVHFFGYLPNNEWDFYSEVAVGIHLKCLWLSVTWMTFVTVCYTIGLYIGTFHATNRKTLWSIFCIPLLIKSKFSLSHDAWAGTCLPLGPSLFYGSVLVPPCMLLSLCINGLGEYKIHVLYSRMLGLPYWGEMSGR